MSFRKSQSKQKLIDSHIYIVHRRHCDCQCVCVCVWLYIGGMLFMLPKHYPPPPVQAQGGHSKWRFMLAECAVYDVRHFLPPPDSSSNIFNDCSWVGLIKVHSLPLEKKCPAEIVKVMRQEKRFCSVRRGGGGGSGHPRDSNGTVYSWRHLIFGVGGGPFFRGPIFFDPAPPFALLQSWGGAVQLRQQTQHKGGRGRGVHSPSKWGIDYLLFCLLSRSSLQSLSTHDQIPSRQLINFIRKKTKPRTLSIEMFKVLMC